MKRFLYKTVPALLLLAFLSSSAMAQGRIATVDLRKVFDGYWKTKQATASLKEREAEMSKEDKGMIEDLKKGKEEYQTMLSDANNQALSTEERDKRKKAAEDKLKQLKQMEDNITEF